MADFEAFLGKLEQGRRIIRYDSRGSGLSQRELSDFSNDALVFDLEAVIDSAGVDRFSLWATAMSGPRAITYASRHPDKVERLVLHGTTDATQHAFPPAAVEAYATVAMANMEMAAKAFTDVLSDRRYPDEAAALATILAQSVSGDVAAAVLRAAATWNVTAEASALSMPVLVLHGTDDRFAEQEYGYDLASRIPDARFVSLTGGVSYAFLGDTDQLLDSLEDFLPRAAGGKRIDRTSSVHTILFTDVQGSSAMTQRLGDANAREVFREHERITRAALKVHGGSEVKTMGDGFMVSFTSAVNALQCAIELQQAFAKHNESAAEPIKIRVGLNAGEPIAEAGPDGRSDLFGTSVNLAARICSNAEPGQILASTVVRELVAGKGFLFADLGATGLRGFEDPVRLYDLRWQLTDADDVAPRPADR